MEYRLKFELPYINCNNYKEKEANNFISILNGSRVGLLLNGYTYGMITYDEDDKQKVNPIVTVLPGFARSKTNCIIFNLKNNKYNKLFLYQTVLKDSGFYGLVAYNTETNKMLHIFNIEFDYTQLLITMQRIIKNNQT